MNKVFCSVTYFLFLLYKKVVFFIASSFGEFIEEKHTANRLNACALPQLYMLKSTAWYDGIWSWDLWEVIRSPVGMELETL